MKDKKYLLEIGDRIKKLRLSLGMSQEELAKACGYSSRSTINKIELGVNDIPRSKIILIAKVLNVAPSYLMEWDLVDDDILDIVNEIDDDILTSVKGNLLLAKELQHLRDRGFNNVLPISKTKKIPLLGTIACGEPILADENLDGDVDIPEEIKADFALRCKGDSMIEARIMDGDIVYIRQQPTVYNGEIAAVLIGDEATLKRVYITDNKLTLMPCNPKYPPMVYTDSELEEVRILGKAVGFTSQVD